MSYKESSKMLKRLSFLHLVVLLLRREETSDRTSSRVRDEVVDQLERKDRQESCGHDAAEHLQALSLHAAPLFRDRRVSYLGDGALHI